MTGARYGREIRAGRWMVGDFRHTSNARERFFTGSTRARCVPSRDSRKPSSANLGTAHSPAMADLRRVHPQFEDLRVHPRVRGGNSQCTRTRTVSTHVPLLPAEHWPVNPYRPFRSSPHRPRRQGWSSPPLLAAGCRFQARLFERVPCVQVPLGTSPVAVIS